MRYLRPVLTLIAAFLVTGLAVLVWSFIQYLPSHPPLVPVEAGPWAERGPPPADAPHVVLIIGCTVRRDQLSIHGGPDGISPFMQALADDGTVFDDAVTAAPWTRAAATAILTGHHPLGLGMVEPAHSRNDRILPDDVSTLASFLQGAGYETFGVTTNPNLNAAFGFARGYDHYREPPQLWREDLVKVSGERVASAFVDMLDQRRLDGPVYLRALLVEAHAPYTGDLSDSLRFGGEDIPNRVANYRAGLVAFDEAVAGIAAVLEERGLTADNTLYVVVNDHGEGLFFPRHHGKSHGRFVAPSVVGGVWVMRGPGIPAGQRLGGLVSQIDVTPTLLGLLGIEGYTGPGLDHSALVRGAPATAERNRAWVDTWFGKASRAAVYTPAWACQADFGIDPSQIKENRPFQNGCFRRAEDPAHEHPLRFPELENELRVWRAKLQARAQNITVLQARPSEELSRQLEALGYADE